MRSNRRPASASCGRTAKTSCTRTSKAPAGAPVAAALSRMNCACLEDFSTQTAEAAPRGALPDAAALAAQARSVGWRGLAIDRAAGPVRKADPDLRIDLSGIDANSGLNGNQAFSFIGTAAFSHTAGELHYAVTRAGAVVSGDVNGVQAAPLFNVGKRVSGIQLGLVNVADDLRGIQIGLVNVAFWFQRRWATVQ